MAKPKTDKLQIGSNRNDGATIARRLIRRAIRSGKTPIAELGAKYELLLQRGAASTRRATGCYYTPQPFIDCLLDRGLEPLLARAADPAHIRIADPSCGDGRFLAAAARRIARRGVPIAHVVRDCLFGVDSDPVAVELCRAVLADLGGVHVRTVHSGDGLRSWRAGSFDAVIGNPPFRNAIEGEPLNAPAHPLVRGTADLAYYFLARALDIVKPGGVVALVQPRPVLNSPAMAEFRQRLRPGMHPNAIIAPESSRLFAGALIFACGLVLGPANDCAVSRDGEHWSVGRLDDANWWSGFRALLDGRRMTPTCGPTLDDEFEIGASMTAGDAYDLKPFIRENRRATCGRLVTTGLIDPGVCHWGHRRCRYLGRDLEYPQITAAAGAMSASLRRRLSRSRRPKILVAGLSKRVECVLDLPGRLVGAVSTFTIVHRNDDEFALRRLTDWLHSPEVDRRFHDELGANAVGGGDVVMRKQFLRDLPAA